MENIGYLEKEEQLNIAKIKLKSDMKCINS